MNENDVLGFDPSQLSVFSQSEKSANSANSLIYHTRPEESKSEDGVYRSTIKIIYNPFDLANSIFEQQGYWLEDADGGFMVVSALTNNDTNCPIFKAWKKCRYSDPGTPLWKQQAKATEGGNELFNKHFSRYATIQVMEDKNHPELEGKYMFMKLPKSIYDQIKAKTNPSKESGKCPIPIMDFLFGRSIDLEVKPGEGAKGSLEYKRGTSYFCEFSEDTTCCTNPDKSPLLNTEEQMVLKNYVNMMRDVWKEKDPLAREKLLQNVNADPNTAKLRGFYPAVIARIKEFCPNLVEEFKYKEWEPNVAARVQKWIDCVLSGNIPKQMAPSSAPEMKPSSAADDVFGPMGVTPTAAPQPTPTAQPSNDFMGGGSSDDDDLPF